MKHLHVVRDADTEEIDLPPSLRARLLRAAAACGRQPGDLVDALLCDAMEAPTPARLRATLACTRCGFTPHRWARTVLTGRGEFAHLFGCTRCYRLRRFGTVAIRGCEQPDDAPEPEPEPVKVPVLWLVPPQDWACAPGVPEALQ
jgi:hypothetical protein